MNLYATIQHHSLAQAPTIQGSDLAALKRAATARFGDGFADHTIIIVDADTEETISRRRIADRNWTDTER